ncbi:MAG: PA14 domain-containing protein, partial [Actinomycetota bacterium]|nr:PA14 domain-containing protein [Actinomycetota bacterium]
MITTATPVLSTYPGTDPDGGPVKMWFRATPAPDAENGAKVVDSGWLTATPAGVPCPAGRFCYGVQPGSLVDGVTYSWHVWTWDGETGWVSPNWTRSFRVDLRLGDKGPFPRDTMGPAQVNLANGNMATGVSSPTFPSVGGPIGLSYAYNSQATPSAVGLTGAYYLANAGNNIDTASPVLTRRDPDVNFFWYGTPPAASMPTTGYMARWSGWVSVPVTGTYNFGASQNGGVRIRVGTTTVLDAWYDHYTSPPVYGSAVSLTAGTKVAIQVDYFQATGTSFMMLFTTGPLGAGGAQVASSVPESWLSTANANASAAALSPGWTLAPAGVGYASARVEQYSVVFTDAAGAAHTYLWTGSGFAPPPDEDGVVGQDSFGRLTLHATDGYTYTFDAAGRLSSVIAGVDDYSPASPV